jgi:hypothetical protein
MNCVKSKSLNGPRLRSLEFHFHLGIGRESHKLSTVLSVEGGRNSHQGDEGLFSSIKKRLLQAKSGLRLGSSYIPAFLTISGYRLEVVCRMRMKSLGCVGRVTSN